MISPVVLAIKMMKTGLFHILLEPFFNYRDDLVAVLFQHHHMAVAMNIFFLKPDMGVLDACLG
jgi:hypothetical protein